MINPREESSTFVVMCEDRMADGRCEGIYICKDGATKYDLGLKQYTRLHIVVLLTRLGMNG